MTKVCTKCRKEKPLSAFSVRHTRGGKPLAQCKVCCREKLRKWRDKNPVAEALSRRKQCVKKFGISVGDYERLFFLQGGVCAICREVNTDNRMLCVDHSHTTGKIRGLLCTTCNAAIGMLGDGPDGIRAALRYLEETEVA